MRKLVKLKTNYTDARTGGGNVVGETVSLPADVAEGLVSRGAAEYVDHKPVQKERVFSAPTTKPMNSIPADLKGNAKKKWFAEKITAKGETLNGSLMADLEAQYKELYGG